ncbi:MAG: nucleoside triphosphate pyrophosphohydrolase [bacterium]|nr:nucleoside triphosphate pyrophosphohydrolase [bacterium]
MQGELHREVPSAGVVTIVDSKVAPMDRLLALMARLRDPENGCPWDLEQRFETIAPYTIEEAYEVDDAIRRGDRSELRDELGDLLFQVVFHARMAEEAGDFAFSDVVDAVCEKMERRHPHVFGAAPAGDATHQTRRWEEIKAEERRQKGDPGVPLALPALTRAAKLQRRALNMGRPELLTSRGAATFGDRLFAMVSEARLAGLDPEQALREANADFEGALDAPRSEE